MLSIEKGITLGMIDDSWKEHLRELDDLKQSVQSATYEQKDPLLIYKFESFNLFKDMIQKINSEVVSFLAKGNLPMQDADSVKEAQAPRGLDHSRLKEERTDLLSQAHSDTQGPRKTAPVTRTEKKYGRNDKVKVQYNDGRVTEKKYKMNGRVGQIEPTKMEERHNELALEMLNRGYNHQSPYKQPDVSYLPVMVVDRDKSIKILRE